MIDFLNYVGIDKKTIMEMKQRYNESDLYDLACNQDNCLKIIEIEIFMYPPPLRCM